MDVYEELADHLNSLPSGVATNHEGAVDSHLLRELFAPDEARIAQCLTLVPEEIGVIAYRAGVTYGEARQRLEDMAERGVIVSTCEDKDGQPCLVEQYLIGIWRFITDDWRPGRGRVPAYPV